MRFTIDETESCWKIFLIEILGEYAIKDKIYKTSATTITTKRFGPSGSSKNTNITLEHTTDVTPKITNEVFLKLKYILIRMAYAKYQRHRQSLWFYLRN